ncbi:hypothetical protein [Streptomyces kaniharaensis]|uniref:hypothetical protein n=1 Tax=Streptomyces kaniharaensis TaxID=212423 RepID=UPI0012951701|nr:hypothetical protein [Streptomyces kaniharaensis]
MHILHHDHHGTPPGAENWLAGKVESWKQIQTETGQIHDQAEQLRQGSAGGVS